MNEDAFARRFYADRAELESLGIQLTVEQPADGVAEQENYSLRPENFHLPAIAFTDARARRAADRADAARRRVRLRRAAAPRAAADLLGPAEPARRARASGASRSASPASAGGHELSQRLAKIETAIFRNKTITFDYYTMERDDDGRAQGRPVPPALPGRPVLPARPLARARRAARLPPVAHPRQGRLRDEGRARLQAPDGLRPARATPTAPSGSSATPSATAEIRVSERIAWQVERHFGRFGDGRAAEDDGGDIVFTHRATPTAASSPPGCCASASTRASSARRSSARGRRARRAARRAPPTRRARARAPRSRRGAATQAEVAAHTAARAKREAAIRPERFARLVTLASILIEAGRARRAARRRRRLRAPADLRRRAARGHQRPQRRQLRRRLLRALRRGPRRRHDRGRPRALLRQLRAPGAPAAGRGQGARRRDRPDRRPPARGLAARPRARRSSPRSAPTRWSRACRSPRAGGDDSEIARVVSRGDRRAPAARARVLQAQRGRVLRARRSSPTR